MDRFGDQFPVSNAVASQLVRHYIPWRLSRRPKKRLAALLSLRADVAKSLYVLDTLEWRAVAVAGQDIDFPLRPIGVVVLVQEALALGVCGPAIVIQIEIEVEGVFHRGRIPTLAVSRGRDVAPGDVKLHRSRPDGHPTVSQPGDALHLFAARARLRRTKHPRVVGNPDGWAWCFN